MACRICPRNCAGRDNGICGVRDKIIVSRIAPHYWEEPVISGKNGSGTVFFAGCSLKCVFCQNYEISHKLQGAELSAPELESKCRKLCSSGVHNLSFVTPSHYVPLIRRMLENNDFCVPIVYNSSGYDSLASLKSLNGLIDIYMPDMKYISSSLSEKYSGAPDYFENASIAIEEMYRQSGDAVTDDNGIMQKGVIIRHLVLPDNLENTYDVLDWFSDFSKDKKIYFSLMSQFTPHGDLSSFPELQRRITAEEYEKAVSYMQLLGIDGFTQEIGSACEKYIPDFSEL